VPTRAPPTPEPTAALPTATPEPPPAPQPAACSPAGVINDLARLRSGPGTNYAALTMMPANAQVQVTARNPAGDWYQIVFNGETGWVFGGLVNLICAEDLPVVDVPPPTTGPAQPPAPPPAQPQPLAGDKVLYFTFDDGPNSVWTPQMLDILARYNARGVFFQIGQQVPVFQDVSRQAIAQGHAIGNHTWDHPSLAGMDEATFNDQIMRTDQVLAEVGAFQNAGQKCMRPPYGATDGNTRARLEALGYTMMLWQLDTNDWRLPGADQIVRYVLDNAYSGAVVLMHDGGGNRAQSAAALEVILQTLGQQGWRFEPACR